MLLRRFHPNLLRVIIHLGCCRLFYEVGREATSYTKLIAPKVAIFIKSHIIYQYEVPNKLILDSNVHFRGELKNSFRGMAFNIID